MWPVCVLRVAVMMRIAAPRFLHIDSCALSLAIYFRGLIVSPCDDIQAGESAPQFLGSTRKQLRLLRSIAIRCEDLDVSIAVIHSHQ